MSQWGAPCTLSSKSNVMQTALQGSGPVPTAAARGQVYWHYPSTVLRRINDFHFTALPEENMPWLCSLVGYQIAWAWWLIPVTFSTFPQWDLALRSAAVEPQMQRFQSVKNTSLALGTSLPKVPLRGGKPITLQVGSLYWEHAPTKWLQMILNASANWGEAREGGALMHTHPL